MLAVHLFLNDDLERARALLERAGVRAAERGAEIERAWVLFYLMWLEWLAGRWQVALSHIAEAKELAEQAQDEFLGPQLRESRGVHRGAPWPDRGGAREGRICARSFRGDFERDPPNRLPFDPRPHRARARQPGGSQPLPARPTWTACSRSAGSSRAIRSGRTRSKRLSASGTSTRRGRTSSSTSDSQPARGGWPAATRPAAAAFWPLPRAT